MWPDTFVSEATLASVVSELRAALQDDPRSPRYVRTVHGHGYAFSGEAVEEAAAAPAGTPARGRRWMAGAGAALGLLLLAGGALALRGRREPAPAVPPSLAVLPLQDTSGDPGQAHVVDGLTEALATSLSRVDGLRVVARTSALRYRDPRAPLAGIARELGAELLVLGAAEKTGDAVRLTARLVDAPRDRELWSRRYECAFAEAAELPERVARDIVAAARLGTGPRPPGRPAATVDPEAYNAYLKGRHQLARGLLESNRAAIDLFQESLGRDPGYAPAYAQLANAYNTLASVWAGEPPRPMRALAAAAAQKALELDPGLADAHTHLGHVQLYDWDFAGAASAFQRAIELDPGAAGARVGHSYYLLAHGRMDEAIAEARRAERLDPLSVRARRNVGYALFHARRYDEAIAHLQGVVATEPRDTFTRWFLGMSYSLRNRHPEAVAELRQAVELSERGPILLGALAAALARAGRAEEARGLLAELRATAERRYVSPAAFIVAHSALGEREQALQWLERGFEERINFMIFLGNMADLDPLRGDPRFRDLVRRIGLPQR